MLPKLEILPNEATDEDRAYQRPAPKPERGRHLSGNPRRGPTGRRDAVVRHAGGSLTGSPRRTGAPPRRPGTSVESAQRSLLSNYRRWIWIVDTV